MGRRLLVGLLAACLVVPALAFAAGKDPKERFTAADQAKARSFLVKRGDLLAGWKSRPSSTDDNDDFTCSGYDPDLSDLTLTGEAVARFTHPAGGYLASSSSVYETERDAKASWSRVVKPALARCLGRAMAAVDDDSVHVKVTASTRVPFARVAERVVAYRLVFTMTDASGGKPLPFTLYMIGLGNGRADLLITAAAPFKGFPFTDLRAMTTVLSQRMVAANV